MIAIATSAAADPPRPPYASLAYANAFGLDIADVPEWGTPVLIRPIPDSDWKDVLGCYPLAVLSGDADLEGGLERLRAAGLVSVALVLDPLSGPPSASLARAFSVCRPLKKHFLIDRGLPLRIAKTHRQMIRRAQRECRMERLDLAPALEEWVRLYRQMIGRHGVVGLQNFPPEYFRALAQMDRCCAIAAYRNNVIVAMALWIDSGAVVYYHLAASAPEGYEAQAMYGIVAAALEVFTDAQIIELGGPAGLSSDPDAGLAYFKRGFANREIDAYFCGACLHAERYALLTAGSPATTFFPAYRQP